MNRAASGTELPVISQKNTMHTYIGASSTIRSNPVFRSLANIPKAALSRYTERIHVSSALIFNPQTHRIILGTKEDC